MDLDLVCSLMPVQFRPSPPIDDRGGIAPVMNNVVGFGFFIAPPQIDIFILIFAINFD